VDVSDDLAYEAVSAALPGRAVRTYPALLSTDADARAWGRGDAPDGAVVVADYQASPRGRAGLPWTVEPGSGLGFSVVLRPALTTEREGWLYTVALAALADVVGDDAIIRWPDEVEVRGERAAAVGVYAELGAAGVTWAVVTVLLPQAAPPRAPLLAQAVAALEARLAQRPDGVLTDYLARCATLGRTLRARLIPMSPGGPQVVGQAVDCRLDGALVLATDAGRHVPVRPQDLGLLEEAS
jgi:BirA family biotin operon repressor/biotin-[acetyl-CoA-carboxylase] ligase